MNEHVIEEKYKKLIDYVKGLSEREKEILTEYLNKHREDFHNKTIATLVNGLNYTMQQYISETLLLKPGFIQNDDEGKSKSITDILEQERGKAFVQSMSSNFQSYKDSMQSSRDSRYEEMYIDKKIDAIEPVPVKNYIDNNYIDKETYLNKIDKEAYLNKIYSMVNATDKKYSFDEIVKAVGDSNPGVTYYLTQYLKFNPVETANVDYEQMELQLEKQYMDSVLPFISKNSNLIRVEQSNIDLSKKGATDDWLNRFSGAMFMSDPELINIVGKLSSIGLNKIANKQPLSGKEYGFILYNIALREGDFLDSKNYNMLYLGLYHELSSNQNFGSFAEQYLNEKVKKMGVADKYFLDEDPENKSIRR